MNSQELLKNSFKYVQAFRENYSLNGDIVKLFNKFNKSSRAKNTIFEICTLNREL